MASNLWMTSQDLEHATTQISHKESPRSTVTLTARLSLFIIIKKRNSCSYGSTEYALMENRYWMRSGTTYKDALKAILDNDSRMEDIADIGSCKTTDKTAYSLVAEAARLVVAEECDRMMLICGTGLGIAIAANHIFGIRAVTVHDRFCVERSIPTE
ncbi:hypothetical protein F5B19DRAFT_175447 [Rostrohypoxylon terebratum]|nr:hypothetical protein F5B19DRAFT_175447 [Rostrohypoxylon terebratum]